MSDRLLMHTIDACTRTARHDTLLRRTSRVERRMLYGLLLRYVVTLLACVSALYAWSQYISGLL
jgi:hypothetical protein